MQDEVIIDIENPKDNDLISRQEAVEAFQMFREYESNRSNKGWVNRIETVLNQLPPVNTQPKTRWIPVSERLPKKNVEVLATTEWGAVTIAEMYSANDWFIHEGTTNAETDEIAAWMPLPEPYEPQESEVSDESSD